MSCISVLLLPEDFTHFIICDLFSCEKTSAIASPHFRAAAVRLTREL